MSKLNLFDKPAHFLSSRAGMRGRERNLKIVSVTKKFLNGRVTENRVESMIRGTFEPMSPVEAQLMPEGLRDYAWYNLLTTHHVQLPLDSIVTFMGKDYRIRTAINLLHRGFMKYECLEDFNGPRS